jgi:alpha-N-arabinofuranosidase
MTPNFYVFEMYAAHQGADMLRTEISAPSLYYSADGKRESFWGLNGSASRKEKTITVTLVHPELEQPKEVQIALRGGTAISASARVLAAGDMHAHNTFERPDAVSTRGLEVSVQEGSVHLSVPPASVAAIHIEMS